MTGLLSALEAPDTAVAYAALQQLERISDDTGALYPHIDQFAAMTASDKYVRRVRGFRLLCRQARWDAEGKLAALLPPALSVLTDEKPTAVRQALAALGEVVRYQPGLISVVRAGAERVDPFRYKDTMQGLLVKDVRALLAACDKAEAS